jgi:hypothetical protein
MEQRAIRSRLLLLYHFNKSMHSLAKEMVQVLAPFASLFAQRRSWVHAQILLCGLFLGHGKRTVSRGLQVLGLAGDAHYITIVACSVASNGAACKRLRFCWEQLSLSCPRTPRWSSVLTIL